MLILNEAEIRGLVDAEAARQVVAEAFSALQRGEATLPSVISLPFSDPDGLAHIKAGYLHSETMWTLKVAADFYPDDTGTQHAGMMLVLSAVDGSVAGLLLDNGFLTELRTGAAGAIAADLLARPDAATAAIVGAGSQAHYQLEALLNVRPIEEVRVASRTRERAAAFVDEIEARFGLSALLCASVEDAVRGAEIVLTTTYSTLPLIEPEWLEPGTHVTAIGSDEPTKQELNPSVLERADVVAVDDRSQAARLGELHHAIETGVCSEDDVITLGELLEGVAQGRESPEDITVADLTGVGVQDAAIASLVVRRAQAERDPRLVAEPAAE
jgi:ornithine cyclodeaminase/alanine dehydrogenase-like protein (mu-crystallin family)